MGPGQYPTDDARLARLEEAVERIDQQQGRCTEFIVEAKTRLGNGQKAFDDLHKRVTDVETQTRPNLSRIATWLAGILMSFGSLIWTGAMMAAERPTFTQAKEIISSSRSEQTYETMKKRSEDQDTELRAHKEALTTLGIQMQMALKSLQRIEEKVERRGR